MLYHNYVFVAVEGIDGSEKTAAMAEVAKPLPHVYVILYNALIHMPLVSTLKNGAGSGKVLRLRWTIPLVFTVVFFIAFSIASLIEQPCIELYT